MNTHHTITGRMTKVLVALAITAALPTWAQPVKVDYSQATVNTTFGASNLVYSLNASGNLVGGAGAGNNSELFTGTAPITSVANILTVSAWNIGTAYPSVVADGVSTDFLEAAVSGTGWNTTGLTQLGFNVKPPGTPGMTPGSDNNTWTELGPEFIILQFNAPPGLYSMDVSTTVANQACAAYVVGNANILDGVGGSSFAKSINPGETFSVLFWNRTTGGAKRLGTITMDFNLIPEPRTAAFMGLGLMALILTRCRRLTR